MFKEKVNTIIEVINDYFSGIYDGDLEKLKRSFSEKSIIYGDINGAAYEKTFQEYLNGVENRKSPAELNETFGMEILGIEIIGNVANAKVHLPMLGYNYYDFLSIALIEGEWKVVNKVFSNVE